MLKMAKDRFRQLLVERSLETEHGAVVRLSDVLGALDALECSHGPCGNEARYDSGYCGIHDLEFNDGQGKRVTHPE